MSKSDVLLGLIKEVVKNEVKQQLKEELYRLAKSGAITITGTKKPIITTPTLKEAIKVDDPFEKANRVLASSRTAVKPSPPIVVPKAVRAYSSNPILNEVLNSTVPFTSAQRAEGGNDMGGGMSILDALQPKHSVEGDWETLNYTNANIPSQQIQTTDDPAFDAVTKALTRDYSQLVKRF